MERIARLLGDTPLFSRFDRWALQYMASLAERRQYKPNEWLFHELEPRAWLGILEEGEVKIVRGQDDQQAYLAVLGPGAILSERIILEDLPHTVGSFAQKGTVIIQFSRETLKTIKKYRPDLYYRIVARITQLLNDRIRYAAERPTIENISYPEHNAGIEMTEKTWNILSIHRGVAIAWGPKAPLVERTN